jgi:UPF0271 protein
MQRRIDLNADVGEGVGDDAAMLALVSSVNVACGFHAGDAATMRRVCRDAVARGVAIGAQPSYRDRAGFGRRRIEIEHDDLVADLVEQIDALGDAATSAGGTVRYLKPHGALYNRAADDDQHAAAVIAACARYRLPVLGLAGSRLLALAAEAGLLTGREFFADRVYDSRGRLVSRDVAGSVIEDADLVASRVDRLLVEGVVLTADEGVVAVEADSICVHGDTRGAVRLAQAVRTAVESHGVRIEAVW